MIKYDNDNFAQMLENSFNGVDSYEPGQLLETEIVSISNDCVFLQLSGKSEGILDLAEMTDKEGNVTVKEGDRIKAFFLEAKNGELRFTTRISSDKAGSTQLRNAFEKGIPVEGVVDKEIKGGFEVKLGESRAFCPYSQMGEKRVEDSAVYIGKHLTFMIIEHEENGRNILVSNRAIWEKAHKEQVDILKETLKEDMKLKGTVMSIQDFGAFVDIGGVQALLPISEISRSRIEDIHKALVIGQEVEVVILKLDWKNERLSVSMKELLTDPWDKAEAKYKKDSKHTGQVVRITDFGAFISLEPGLDGLIHISDLEGDNRDSNPRDVLKTGQKITVKINSLDREKKRISLRPLSSTDEENENFQKYMEAETEETYNPFAALLKGKGK